MKRMILLLTLFALSAPLLAQTTIRIATGLSRPLYVTHAPGDFARIFILEQHTGRVRLYHLDTAVLDPVPFLDIDSLVINTGNERGLLGLAFHPDYQSNRYFYVSYNDNSGTSVIARFTASADPDSAIATSRLNILTQTQPFSNHNGGCIKFGPDGYLYIGLGDGGSGEDPQNNAQNTGTLLGKLLRIDVDSPQAPLNYGIPADNPFVGVGGYRAEIWSLGLRNPWRWSFDRLTGDLYLADVGQYAWEEVNVEPANTGGRNYGWRCLEGYSCTTWGQPACNCNNPAFTAPVTVYSHNDGCSVTGGYVYRGCAIPELYGTYFYADYCSDDIWSFRWDGANGTTDSTLWTAAFTPPAGLVENISSFGEDAFGELYICDLNGGELFKIVPNTLIDCNGNSIADGCDIEFGFSQDLDLDGVPDECDDCLNLPPANLSVAVGEDVLNFRWSNIGGAAARYSLWQSDDGEAEFPAGWTIVAEEILPSGGSASYGLTGVLSLPELGFFKIVTHCP